MSGVDLPGHVDVHEETSRGPLDVWIRDSEV